MSKNIKDIFNEVEELNLKIKQVLYHAEFENYEDLSALEYDNANPDELMMLDELRSMITKLEEISHTINYLSRPIKMEGILRKNSNGRYEIKGHEFSSGCGIEYLATDDWHYRYDKNDEYAQTPYWCASRVEHNGEDYYIVGANDVKLEGLRARVR